MVLEEMDCHNPIKKKKKILRVEKDISVIILFIFFPNTKSISNNMSECLLTL